VIAKDETTPSYLALPKTVVNVDGQVIRLQVTIQVQNKNRDWLATNKKALSDIFPIVVAKINPEDLHSEDGFERVREMLRSELNQSLATDKIDSVLINELLMQNH
jgi:flagellar basal body-associated protein FliL